MAQAFQECDGLAQEEAGKLGNDRGAEAVVAEWAVRYRQMMVMAAMRRGRDWNSAEDVAHAALLVALSIARRDPKTVAKVRDPCRWLVAITRRAERDSTRKDQWRRRILREGTEDIREILFPVPDPGWEVDWLSERVLDVAKEILPLRQLQIIRCTLDGMTDPEVAEALGISRATVRWHRSRAVQTLTSRMGG